MRRFWIDFRFLKKIIWEKWPFSALWKPLHPRLILEKLKTFRFSSIKSSRRVVSSFQCYRKFLLSLETILDTLDVCWNRLDDFFTPSLKNIFFTKILFWLVKKNRPNTLRRKKGFHQKNIFWNWFWKNHLDGFNIHPRYLEWSPESGETFCNFRMMISHV